MTAVDRINYLGFNTNMTGGLKVARLDVFDPDYAKRPYIDRLIVLITDGEPTRDVDKLDSEVAALKRMGVRIFGLGITQQVSLTSCLLRSTNLLIYGTDFRLYDYLRILFAHPHFLLCYLFQRNYVNPAFVRFYFCLFVCLS